MSAFRFDAAAHPDENLAKFWAHLETINAEYAALLKRNISLMLPLPETGSDRSDARTAFNAAIAAVLDAS